MRNPGILERNSLYKGSRNASFSLRLNFHDENQLLVATCADEMPAQVAQALFKPITVIKRIKLFNLPFHHEKLLFVRLKFN